MLEGEGMQTQLISKLTDKAKAYGKYECSYYEKVQLQKNVSSEHKASYENSIVECENGMNQELKAFNNLLIQSKIETDHIYLIGLYVDGDHLAFRNNIERLLNARE